MAIQRKGVHAMRVGRGMMTPEDQVESLSMFVLGFLLDCCSVILIHVLIKLATFR
jgi:hypothetical protein